MIENRRVLGVIPARGGSKGVPRKNLRVVGGKPLIGWTLEATVRSRYLDRTIVSTDDDEIIEVARSLGGDVPFRRPVEISGDAAPHSHAILHALDHVPGYDLVVMLNPTTPLRTAEDIDSCIELCVATGAPACVTVAKTDKPPEWTFRVDDEGRMSSVIGLAELPLLRQDLAPSYVFNGAVYVSVVDWFKQVKSFFSPETRAYKMPASRSIDLDDEFDFMVLEMILRQQRKELGK